MLILSNNQQMIQTLEQRDKINKRIARFENTQFRAIAEEEGKKKVRGYPILFNTPTIIYGEWREMIAPGALEGVDLSKLRLLVGHNNESLLARADVNLRYEIDSVGLFIEAELPDTTLARDTFELVSKGILDGMSFAFWVEEMNTNWEEKIDTILKFKEVPEVSIVTFPAYPQTVVLASNEVIDSQIKNNIDEVNSNSNIDGYLDDETKKNLLLELIKNL